MAIQNINDILKWHVISTEWHQLTYRTLNNDCVINQVFRWQSLVWRLKLIVKTLRFYLLRLLTPEEFLKSKSYANYPIKFTYY